MEVSQRVPWGIFYSRVYVLSLSLFECPRPTFKRDLLLMTDGSLSFTVILIFGVQLTQHTWKTWQPPVVSFSPAFFLVE